MLTRPAIRSPLRPALRSPLARAIGDAFAVSQLFATGEGGFSFETYDPASLVQRRNLLTYSEQADNPAWATGAGIASVTPDATLAPDGTITAALLTEDTATTGLRRRFMPAVNFVAGKTYVVSSYAKPNGRNISLAFPSGNFGPSGVTFDVMNGRIGTVVPGTLAYGIEPAANGFYRCWCSALCTTGGNSVTSFFLNNNVAQGPGGNSYTGDGVSGAYVWGAQVEVGSAPSAYQKITDWNTEYMAAALERIGMWQDSAGTIPVTGIEQPVGLWLDAKYGKTWARGPNVWNAATAVTSGGASVISPGVYRIYSSDGTYSDVQTQNVLTVGEWYEVTFNIDSVTVAGQGLMVSTTGAGPVFAATVGPKRAIFRADTTPAGIKRNAVACDIQISNVAFRKLSSGLNHATQPVSAKRPTVSARVNQFQNTEDISQPFWKVQNANVTGVDILTETATNTVHQLFNTSGFSVAVGQGWVVSADVYPLGRSWVFVTLYDGVADHAAYINLATGAVGTVTGSAVVTTSSLVGGGWRVTVRGTLGGTALQLGVSTATGDGQRVYLGTAGLAALRITRLDLRTADDAAKPIPPYQRVNTTTDYDTVGFPFYVKGDGLGTFMQTPSMDLTAFDKVTAWAAVTKTSDAASAMVLEHSANSSSGSGTFAVIAPYSTTPAQSYAFRSRGTASSDAVTTSAIPAPSSNVLTGIGDIANDGATLRVNGPQAATSATDQGTGTYSDNPAYLFSRAGTSLFFGGRIYGLTVRASTTPTSEAFIAKMNRYVANLAAIPL